MAATPLSRAANSQTVGSVFASRTTIDLYRMSTWEALCDMSYGMSGQYRTVIQKPARTATVESRTIGAAWKASTGQTVETLTLQPDQSYEVVGVEVAPEDVIDSPYAMLEQIRAEQAAKTAIYIDDNLSAYVRGLTYDAANKIAVGSGNYALAGTRQDGGYFGKNNSANAQGNAAIGIVTDALLQSATHFKLKNIDGTAIGASPGTLFAVLPTVIFEQLVREMQSAKYQWDALTDNLFDVRIRNSSMWAGRLFGIDIVSTNSIPDPADPKADGSGDSWKIYVGTRAAVACRIDPPVVSQVLSPDIDQNAGNWVLRQKGRFGRVIVNPSLLTEVTFRTVV